jgi:ketosteroid isomerase-like protein
MQIERPSGIEQHLLNLEREYWQAIQSKDVESARRLTDETCIVTGAQGLARLDGAGLAGMMRNTTFTLDAFEVKDGAEVRLLRDDVAAIAYQVHESLTVAGQKVSLDAADTSIWVKRDGRWRCALHTEALAGDPFGRDRRPLQPVS